MTEIGTFKFKALAVERTPFVKQAGLEKLEDVGRLSIEQLEGLNENYPKAMAQLYVDLIAELAKLQAVQKAIDNGQVK